MTGMVAPLPPVLVDRSLTRLLGTFVVPIIRKSVDGDLPSDREWLYLTQEWYRSHSCKEVALNKQALC